MYIPNSNIVEVDYTYGGIFLLPNGVDFYIGAYHRDKFGNYWTGEKHTPSSVILTNLYPPTSLDFSDSIGNSKFKKKFNIPLNNKSYNNDIIIPSGDDYVRGYFIRYIARVNLSSTLKFIEINKDSYDEIIRDRSNNYTAIEVYWQISGPLLDSFIPTTNIKNQPGILNTNSIQVQKANESLPGVESFLVDLLKYTAPQI